MTIAPSVRRWQCAFAASMLFAAVLPANAASISLADFSFDPGAPVAIAVDGSSATLTESESLAVVFLSNIPGFGDPELIVAAPGAMLRFGFQFDEPAGGNDDVFHVALLDGDNGDVLGGPFEFFASASGNGQVEFDLSSFVGTKLGLQFELAAEMGDAVFSSVLTVSNLEVVPTAAVPLPAALPLMLMAFAGLYGRSRYRSGLA